MAASERMPIDPVSYEFSIDNLTWYLDVSPADGWIDYEETAVAFCVIFAVALFIALLLHNRGQIKKVNEKLQRLAHLDSLTSCYSRHYVNTILPNQRNGSWNDPDSRYSLAIIDIDNFKTSTTATGTIPGTKPLSPLPRYLRTTANVPTATVSSATAETNLSCCSTM